MEIKECLLAGKSKKAKEGTVPYLEISDVDIINKAYTIKEKGSVVGAVFAKKNNVLVSTVRPSRGAITIVRENELAVSNAFAIINVNESICLPKYIFYSLNNTKFFKYLEKNSKGATYPTCSKDDVYNYHITFVEYSTQKIIVDVLDKVSKIIENKKQQLFEYDQLIKSRFVEMFGDISINSKSFDIKPFGDLCFKIGDGLHGTPLYDDKGNYYFINGNNLGNDCIKITETTKKVNEEVFKKYYIQFGENTVFLSINGTLGNVALYNDEPIILGKSAAYCNLKPSLHIKFVAELFKTNKFKEYMLSNSSGTTITNFGLKAFRNYPMIVPPMIFQTQFTKFVEQVDKLKFVVQKSLDETQKLFDSLMQEYFG